MVFAIWSILATAAAAALVVPKQDPFYQPSGNWKDAKPGAILAHRNVPNNLTGIDYSAAYQLLYRSVDALGAPIAAITTVIIPKTPDYSKLLSYQVVYDTPDPNCSPSFVLQNGTSIDTGFTYGLSLGWIVNSPDYEGPNAAFTNGPISGQATLDSIRAALSSTNITKIKSNAQVAMWGYSGGALASEWAAELQSSYAPELNISGTAMGGLTPNVSSVALTVNNSTNAGLAAAGIVGITAAYPNLTTFLDSEFVSDADKTDFFSVRNECISQIGSQDSGKDILGFFKSGPALLSDPRAVAAINAGGIMGIHGMPVKSNKLYVYKTTLDEVSPVADTDALVEKYCKAGLSIEYVKNNYGTHPEEALNGGTGAFLFLSNIFSGISTNSTGCKVTTLNKNGTVISSSTILPTASSSSTSLSGSSYSATASPTSSGSGSGAGSPTSGVSGTSSPAPTGAATFLQPLQLGAIGGLALLVALL